MSTFKNTSGATINLGSTQVASQGTITDEGFSYLAALKWFYERKYFSLVDGTDTYLTSRPSSSPTIMQTASVWNALNPILYSNQKGIELDTGKYKYGDGAKTWRGLAYSGTDLATVTTTNPGSVSLVAMEKLATIEAGADVTDADNIALNIYNASTKTTLSPVDIIPILDTESTNELKTVTPDKIIGTRKSAVTTSQNLTSTTTLTNITGLVQNGLVSGKIYDVEAKLFITSTANTGFKCAFAAENSLSATFFKCVAESRTSAGAMVVYTVGTAITDSLCDNAAAVSVVTIRGTLSVNVGGTLRLKVAPHASHTDTFTVLTGSTLAVTQIG